MKWTAIVLVFAAACAGRQQNTETLAESIRSFNEGVRWQRYEVAAVSIPPRERSKFVEMMDERAEDLKITDYEIVRVDRRSDKEAQVHVKVSWYMDNQGTLKETHAMQIWQRKNKTWLMIDQSRYRGDEMPGLLERLRDEDAEEDPDDPDSPETAVQMP
ncbi:MAG: hypothetical protein H0T65_01285 [Deltaproteobacteria bacterium]|nr:hypothetical protein [Deltaproteobacteria bacterium]